MSALMGLRERVLAATGPDHELDGDFAILSGWTFVKMKGDRNPYWRKPGVTDWYVRSELPNFTASIDAALGLVERELPGCDVLVCRVSGAWEAECGEPGTFKSFEGKGNSAPLAILTTLLSALIAKNQA